MARTFKSMLNNSGKSGHPCLFLILEEMLLVFHHWKLYLLSICQVWPYYVDTGYLYAHFLESFFFYPKWVMNFIKCLFYWDDHVVFVFFDVSYFIDWFTPVGPTCDPGMNPSYSRYMISFMYCWIWFADILLRIFLSVFINDIDL